MKIHRLYSMLRERRKALGLSQPELARLSGISVHTLINLEAGRGSPTLRTVEAVATTLGYHLALTLTPPPMDEEDE